MSIPLLLCIDPGTVRTGLCILDPELGRGGEIVRVWRPSDVTRDTIRDALHAASIGGLTVALERASAQGRTRPEVIETAHLCGWIEGQCEALGLSLHMLRRHEVKSALDVRGGDAAVSERVAEIMADTASLAAAKGSRGNPGPCYGLVGDAWQAAAVGLAVAANLRRSL